MTDTPLSLYRAKLAAGGLKHDPVQALAVEKLESLHHALRGYQPATGAPGWKARFGLARRERAPTPPQGLYLYGPVGRGKSMLMDLFFRTAPVQAKRRLHFQEFMRDFHSEIHAWRAGRREHHDPVPPLATRMVERGWLLCLDELEVHDIADAMIVGRVFQELMERGAVVVTTSNRHPDDLYKDGLQREKFLPFIGQIKARLDLLHLASETDYRLGRLKGSPVFHTPLGPDSDKALDSLFAHLANGRPVRSDAVFVSGRRVPVPRAAGDVARFSFNDLCEQPLGPADYMHIASVFDAVVVDRVPCLGPENRNAARRFVTLVDAFYEHRTLLAMSADAPPEALYPTGDGAFEFQRTVSRLMEMQSEDYLGATHLP